MTKKKTVKQELPEDLVSAVAALKSMAQDHVQTSEKQINNAQTVIQALKRTIDTLEGKVADAKFEPPEGFSCVSAMSNFKSIIEGATVNKATHDALQDMWLRVSRVMLTEEEFNEHFLKKADAAE